MAKAHLHINAFFEYFPSESRGRFLIWCFGDLIEMHGGKKVSVAICVRLNLRLTGLKATALKLLMQAK